ncbi:MAG: phosphate acyltransferase, partial [Longimicrobiales bacterium]
LGFPFIFRGALDVRARAINDEMKLAATHALAGLAREPLPEDVTRAYGGEEFEFGREYLIPTPFDSRVLLYVAPAVAKAAMDSGVARVQLDLDEYRDRLRASLGPGREVMRGMVNRARRDPRRVVLIDGYNLQVIQACAQIVEEGIARPILIGRRGKLEAISELHGISLDGVEIVHPVDDEETRHRYAAELYRMRLRKGLTEAEARSKMYQPQYYGGIMVHLGDADAMVGGIELHYAEMLRPALQILGRAEGVSRAAALYMLALPNRQLLFFADTAVNIDPDADALAEIAVLTAGFVEELGLKPRIAMISFSNFGSASHEETKKVRAAVKLVRERRPDLEVDGEMQADTAVNWSTLSKTYPFTELTGPANVLVFPTLTAANVSYKLLDELSDAEAIGPVLLGMSRPVNFLQRGATVDDVINLVTLACVDSQSRSAQN